MKDAYSNKALAFGNLYAADFENNRLTFRVEGDMPPVARGRFAMIDARAFASIVRAANLWVESQQ